MLERAFDEIAADGSTGRALSVEPTGDLAHAGMCRELSDFGFGDGFWLATGWAESRGRSC